MSFCHHCYHILSNKLNIVNLKDIQLSQKLRLGLGMKMCISEIAHLNNIRFMIYWGNAILNLNYCSSQWCTLRCRTFLHMLNAFELLSKTINIFTYTYAFTKQVAKSYSYVLYKYRFLPKASDFQFNNY